MLITCSDKNKQKPGESDAEFWDEFLQEESEFFDGEDKEKVADVFDSFLARRKGLSVDEFKETEHPRGQPENAGQFVAKGKGGAGKKSEKKPAEKKEGGWKSPITPEQDAKYLSLVKSGKKEDLEDAQRMVDEAAELSGLPIIEDDSSIAYKIRRGAAPKKTIKAYKLFRSENGELYPLFVSATDKIPKGVWLDAIAGQREETTKTGAEKVKSKLGALAYRPGWHLGDLPLATHIGIKKGKKVYARRANEVWAECEVIADVDYQPEADKNGRSKKTGKIVVGRADIKHMPDNGMYRYKTNANMTGKWIITGSMKVNRVLSEEEVNTLIEKAGHKPMPWEGGELDLKKLGLNTERTSNRHKLLDTVTYDDDGNVIPLSKRFNPESEDVRDSDEVNTETYEIPIEKPIKKSVSPVTSLFDSFLSKRKQKDAESGAHYQGIPIFIENPEGTARHWETKTNSGLTEMYYPYGYIKDTLGRDGDEIDCFLGKDNHAPDVFIIKLGIDDREDKVMLGFPDENSARDAFLAHYDNQQAFGDIVKMPIQEFKELLINKGKKGINLMPDETTDSGEEDLLAQIQVRANKFRAMIKKYSQVKKPVEAKPEVLPDEIDIEKEESQEPNLVEGHDEIYKDYTIKVEFETGEFDVYAPGGVKIIHVKTLELGKEYIDRVTLEIQEIK